MNINDLEEDGEYYIINEVWFDSLSDICG